MGCRLTRTDSTENCQKSETAESNGRIGEKRGLITNGQSVLLRRDTPQHGLDLQRNGNSSNLLGVPNKPIGEVESASQADFFRMLDSKIQSGRDLDSELDD